MGTWEHRAILEGNKYPSGRPSACETLYQAQFLRDYVRENAWELLKLGPISGYLFKTWTTIHVNSFFIINFDIHTMPLLQSKIFYCFQYNHYRFWQNGWLKWYCWDRRHTFNLYYAFLLTTISQLEQHSTKRNEKYCLFSARIDWKNGNH